ncbi:S1/P1 nuclease [Reyranella sp.]|uniref:S1/P1 nuclease n=1 Tax=Reyranella sp. TaxID=1929291 RepID=UPI003D132962
MGRRRAGRSTRDLQLALRRLGAGGRPHDADKHCHASAKGDCIVAELERLKVELRCAPTDDRKCDALRYAVHFVDIHQPMHTVGVGRGGNDVAFEVRLAGAKKCRGGPCQITSYRSNLHRV